MGSNLVPVTQNASGDTESSGMHGFFFSGCKLCLGIRPLGIV